MLYELPNTYVARAYLQERSDRFAVEQLFITREEHHQRQIMRLQEEHEITELFAVFAYSKQELILAIHQDGELELLSKRLQEKHQLTHRRWDIEHLSSRAEDEQEALRNRQFEVDRVMMQREEQAKVAQAQWCKTNAAMDVQIDALRRDIDAMNNRALRRDQNAAINVLVEDQSRLDRLPIASASSANTGLERSTASHNSPHAYRRKQQTSDLSSVAERTNLAIARANNVLSSGAMLREQ